MCDFVGAHPSRGTESACEWAVTSFFQWQQGKTATPRSAPSRRTPRRRNAGRRQSQYRGPVKEGRKSGTWREIQPWETFYKKIKKGSFARGVIMNHLLGPFSRKMKPLQNKEDKGKKGSLMKHILFRRVRSQPGSAVFFILIDTDHHKAQSCLVRVSQCQKCLPVCFRTFFWCCCL